MWFCEVSCKDADVESQAGDTGGPSTKGETVGIASQVSSGADDRQWWPNPTSWLWGLREAC